MAPPIRTLHVEAAEDGTVGGSFRSLTDLARGLPPRGVEPTVLFYQDNPLADELRGAGIEVVVWAEPRARELHLRRTAGRLRRTVDALAAIRRRRSLLRSLAPDVLHLNNNPLIGADDWLPAARLAGIPCVASMRGYSEYDPGALARRALAGYARIIPVSHHVAACPTIRAAPPERVRVIHNGVDLGRIPDASGRDRAREAVRAELGVGGDGFLAVMAGTIRDWKGQLQVVEAVAGLPTPLRDRLTLALAGGWSEEDLPYVETVRGAIARAGLPGQVRVLGHRADILDLLAAADVAIHASLTPEPFGLVLVEALGVGTPLLAADRGGPVEILEEGGGLLHDPEDPSQLRGHLERLMTAPRLLVELASQALPAASRFSIERTRDRMADLYREVLGREAVDRPGSTAHDPVIRTGRAPASP